MNRSFAVLVVLALLSLSSRVGAQDTRVAPEAAAVDLGTHPDEGLMIAGGSLFLLSVTMGVAVLMPIQMSHCYQPGSAFAAGLPPDSGYTTCSQAPYAAIPFAHLVGGGVDSLIGGPILLVAEIVGLFMFIGGAAHHRPNAPAAPSVTLAGVPGAEAGLAVALHF